MHICMKYLRKNMFLVAAFKKIDKVNKADMEDIFLKFHSQVEAVAREHLHDRKLLKMQIETTMKQAIT